LLVRARRAGPSSFLNTVSHLSSPLRPLVSVIAGEPPVLRLRSTSTAPPPRIPRRDVTGGGRGRSDPPPRAVPDDWPSFKRRE
jgi:hypothetical protein